MLGYKSVKGEGGAISLPFFCFFSLSFPRFEVLRPIGRGRGIQGFFVLEIKTPDSRSRDCGNDKGGRLRE